MGGILFTYRISEISVFHCNILYNTEFKKLCNDLRRALWIVSSHELCVCSFSSFFKVSFFNFVYFLIILYSVLISEFCFFLNQSNKFCFFFHISNINECHNIIRSFHIVDIILRIVVKPTTRLVERFLTKQEIMYHA